ncbi:uncharacterized protein LOC109826192 [Asparagus officinalis]|nr:uncharacterized protein LOC109826192 [Asparagus officinalis]XP_020248775.1 uncharacterized protein LOC109826192 [Asparagus officinalis]XP_020248777.1 uncharacterized protein LOC109826192 [Asparagus officinalis]
MLINPAFDYLKKPDSSWEFTNHTDHLNVFNYQTMIGPERYTNSSDSNNIWSVVPPSTTNNVPLNNPSMTQYSDSPSYLPTYIHGIRSQTSVNNSSIGLSNKLCAMSLSGLTSFSSKKQEYETSSSGKKKISEDRSVAIFKKSNRDCSKASTAMSQIGLENLMVGLDDKLFAMTLSDLTSFSSKKQEYKTSSSGKKRRSEDSSMALVKKSKHESSKASFVKLPREKIISLQHIVSPFGKTDTATVLQDTIKYISFLQDQVQLLSDPYVKSSTIKDINSCGGLERTDNAAKELGLRSRGLCLAPISCIPEVYR